MFKKFLFYLSLFTMLIIIGDVTANLKCPAVDGVKCPKIDERAGQVTPS